MTAVCFNNIFKCAISLPNKETYPQMNLRNGIQMGLFMGSANISKVVDGCNSYYFILNKQL